MNSTQIIGRLTRDPEIKHTQGGTIVTNFSIAVNDGYGGNKHTSFFDCVCFAKTAENVQRYFFKGHLIGVEGVLKQETWTSKEGQNRSKIVVIVKSFDFLQPKNEQSNNQQQQNNQQQNQFISDPWAGDNNQQQNRNEEDIPF